MRGLIGVFTLIALTGVGAFLFMVGTAAFPMAGAGERAKQRATRANIALLGAANTAFTKATGAPAPTLTALVGAGGITPATLKDAWGQPLSYTASPTRGSGFLIVSAGPDGAFGTADDICFP